MNSISQKSKKDKKAYPSILQHNTAAIPGAKSKTNFIHKLKIVEEEADESQYFLELLKEITQYKERNQHPENIKNLINEADEIVSIIAVSVKTAEKS